MEEKKELEIRNLRREERSEGRKEDNNKGRKDIKIDG